MSEMEQTKELVSGKFAKLEEDYRVMNDVLAYKNEYIESLKVIINDYQILIEQYKKL